MNELHSFYTDAYREAKEQLSFVTKEVLKLESKDNIAMVGDIYSGLDVIEQNLEIIFTKLITK